MDGHYWNRVGHVTIRDRNGEHQYGVGDNALDFRFQIKRPLAAARIEATIGILGLSMESIHALTCWQPYDVARALNREIEVFAGYEDGGEELVFKGYIIEAKPTNPPNMWLNIKADNLTFHDKKIIKFNHKDEMEFADVVKSFAKACGWVPQIAKDVPKKKIKSINYSDLASKVPQYIETLNDVFTFVENGTLHIVRRIPKENPKKSKDYTLNADTGLIGIAAIDYSSITAKMRLDTRFRLADFVWVESELYPEDAMGPYLVHTVEYNGHLRGQEWETVVHGWNYSNQTKNARSQSARGGR